MKTVILYINKTGELTDELVFFLEKKDFDIEILKYSQEQLHEGNFKKQFLSRLVSHLGDAAPWRLLMVDDRRIKSRPFDLYGGNWELWEIADLFKSDEKGQGFSKVFPICIWMMTTILYPVNVRKQGEKDAYIIDNMRGRSYVCPVRFFYYNFFRQSGEFPEKKAISLALILLELLHEPSLVEYCDFALLYRMELEWNPLELCEYLEDEKKRYKKETAKIDKKLPIDDYFSMPVYEDAPVPVQRWTTDASDKRFAGKTSGRLYKEEIERLKNDIQEKATEEFERIRKTYYYQDRYEWDVESIKRVKEKYEEGLKRLYEVGIWDPEKTEKRLKWATDQSQSINYGTKISCLVQAVGVIAACIYVNGENTLFFYLLLLLLFVVPICYRMHLPVRKMINYERMEIERELENVQLRLKDELSYIAKYRQAYHEYNNILKMQRKREKEQVYMQEEWRLLKTGEQILSRLLQVIGPVELHEHRKREMAKPGNESRHAYPFIESIEIIRQDKEK